MNYRQWLLAGMLSVSSAGRLLAQTTHPDATQPASTQPIQLGKIFRSRVAGIELAPPAGSIMMRQLDTGEIVRFVYNDQGWDIRVKPVPLHLGMPLNELVKLTSKQLLESNGSAEIVDQRIVAAAAPMQSIGIIEARYNAGVDRLFTQQALFRSDDQNYYLIQMGSPTGKMKNAPVDPPDAQEAQARAAFTAMLPSVHLLDREALRTEQEQRLLNTRQLWVQIDQRKILNAINPVHFVRVIQDGKDIGFVQYNERQATHTGRDGIEVIVRSRVMRMPVDATQAAIAPEPSGIVVPRNLAPTMHSNAPAKASNLYTDSTFFFSFDRVSGYVSSHEDWLSLTQIDDQKAGQISELGLSDLVEHRVLDARVNQARATTQQEPVFLDRPEYTLSVSQYVRFKLMGQPFDAKLVWFYLPQGIGQLLPRLLPGEAKQYMFATYISSERNIMGRYVDVNPAGEFDLGGQKITAIPVSDRIGVDGIPTINYLSRSGEWLGSVNEDSKLQCLPATAEELAVIWPNFKVGAEPPLGGK